MAANPQMPLTDFPAPPPLPIPVPPPAPSTAAREEEPFPISLIIGEIYDGPLDLLLALIRKQNIDIYDIPIALITKQFQQCFRNIKVQDIEVAGDFFLMASQLIHIKSKMLLPREPVADAKVPDDDPRRDLVSRLLEHERFKQAAEMLRAQQTLTDATWTQPGLKRWMEENCEQVETVSHAPEVDSIDLAKMFSNAMERAASRPSLDIEQDSVTVQRMIEFLHRSLARIKGPVILSSLLGENPEVRTVTAAFLAALEMARIGAIHLRQESAFGEIRIKPTADFEGALNRAIALQLEWS